MKVGPIIVAWDGRLFQCLEFLFNREAWSRMMTTYLRNNNNFLATIHMEDITHNIVQDILSFEAMGIQFEPEMYESTFDPITEITDVREND